MEKGQVQEIIQLWAMREEILLQKFVAELDSRRKEILELHIDIYILVLLLRSVMDIKSEIIFMFFFVP